MIKVRSDGVSARALSVFPSLRLSVPLSMQSPEKKRTRYFASQSSSAIDSEQLMDSVNI
jgi:hypothetical protein